MNKNPDPEYDYYESARPYVPWAVVFWLFVVLAALFAAYLYT